jgi:hypothetical protein
MGKEESSAEPMSQTTVALIAVVTLVVGFVAGYYLAPQETVEAETTPDTDSGLETTFEFNMEKVNNLASIFEDYYYVASGGTQASDFEYASYNEYPTYVEIVYTVDGTQTFPVYISKDYTTLYPQVLGVEEFKLEIEDAKASMAQQVEEPAEMQKSETPEVLLFVMSFCPYGNVAEDAMDPVVDLLGETMNFEPIYIVSQTGDGGWTSLHGNVELNQDVREKIIYNLYGPDVWMDYVYKVNAQCNYMDADECWTGPAEELGINTTEVEGYFSNSTYVDELLGREAMFTAVYGVSGSPTLIINGKTHSIERTPESYRGAICDAYLSPPEVCNETLSEEGGGASGSC